MRRNKYIGDRVCWLRRLGGLMMLLISCHVCAQRASKQPQCDLGLEPKCKKEKKKLPFGYSYERNDVRGSFRALFQHGSLSGYGGSGYYEMNIPSLPGVTGAVGLGGGYYKLIPNGSCESSDDVTPGTRPAHIFDHERARVRIFELGVPVELRYRPFESFPLNLSAGVKASYVYAFMSSGYTRGIDLTEEQIKSWQGVRMGLTTSVGVGPVHVFYHFYPQQMNSKLASPHAFGIMLGL